MRWVLLFVGLLAAWTAAAAAPILQLSRNDPAQPLAGLMSLAIVPKSVAADPETFWSLPAAKEASGWSDNRWVVRGGNRIVGRISLQSAAGRDVYVIQVPDALVDRVQLWYREPGQAWRSAEAGDRVPLRRWPYFGQFPSFILTLSEQPVDVIMAVENAEPEAVPIWLRTDAGDRETRLLQANFTGLVVGLGAMGALMCLIAAHSYRRRPNWIVLVYSIWALVVIVCTNGYQAIWITPQATEFNDISKDFSLVVMGALLVSVIAEVLDHLDFLALRRWVTLAALVLGIAYACVHTWLVPGESKPLYLLLWEGLCVLFALLLCVVSWLRGARHVGLPAAAIVGFSGMVAMQYDFFDFSHGFDLTSPLAAVLLLASAQVLRHGLFVRERYGRDVLGRAAISATRDPLTALLSYTGMQHAYEEAMLRQHAGRGPIAMMMFTLPKFDDASVEHGMIVAERALVRFAAALQNVLGNEWAIGRISKTRFGAVTTTREGVDGLVQCATRVLSHCARLNDPLSPVNDFDLRIICAHRAGKAVPLVDLLRDLDDGAVAIEGNKRIAVV